jgi:HD-GYP domain-containing protein (c-di-GMP phosphodiesterase class II)
MKLVVVSEKLIGEKLANNIYTENGILFIRKGNDLTEGAIKRLLKMGIVTVYVEDGNTEVNLQEVLETSFKLQMLKALKDLFDEAKKTNWIDKDRIFDISKDIIQNINLSENAVMVNNLAPSDEIAKLAVHSLDVAMLAVMISCRKRYDEKKMSNLVTAALLHDIGKLFTDKNDFHKLGYELLKSNSAFGATVYMSIYQQNEREDSSGPLKLRGDKIYEFAKIISICNEYTEVTSSESAVLPHEAIERLTVRAVNKFDTAIFKDFVESIYCYPNGLLIRLNNGLLGIVVAQNKNSPTRPIVYVKENDKFNSYDLFQNLTLFIDKVIL